MNLFSMLARPFAALCLCSALGACSWFGGDDPVPDILTEEGNIGEQRLYGQSQRYLRSGNYQQAIAVLQQLEARFPFGRYAEQAQLEMIYARYQSFDMDSAVASADRFVRLHPSHPNLDYAYYIKGLASFNRNQNIMDRIIESDESKRDMGPARAAYADFAQLLSRFPNSHYAADTKQRMVYLRNVLARAELNIADYYMRRAAYVAASNRASFVLENYPGAQVTDEALLVLIEANHRLGLEQESNNALRVLALNYPEHQAFDEKGNLVLTKRVRNRDRFMDQHHDFWLD